MKIIKSWEDVPLFSSEKDETKFWTENQIDPALMEAAVSSSETESTTITIRFDPRMLARLKRIARQRYLNYQSMMKQWIAERLEKELRDSAS